MKEKRACFMDSVSTFRYRNSELDPYNIDQETAFQCNHLQNYLGTTEGYEKDNIVGSTRILILNVFLKGAISLKRTAVASSGTALVLSNHIDSSGCRLSQ